MAILTRQAKAIERRLKLRLSEIDSDEQRPPKPPKPIPSLEEARQFVWSILWSNASNYYKAADDYYKNKKVP